MRPGITISDQPEHERNWSTGTINACTSEIRGSARGVYSSHSERERYADFISTAVFSYNKMHTIY